MGFEKQKATLMFRFFKTKIYTFYLLWAFPFVRRKKYYYSKEKTLAEILRDLLFWLLRNERFNENYFVFGLNIKNNSQKNYIGRNEFLRIKIKSEKILNSVNNQFKISYDVLCKDKFVFHAFFKTLAIPTVPVIGLVGRNGILEEKGKFADLGTLFKNQQDFVLKNTLLEYGDGFMLCKPLNDQEILANGKKVNLDQLKQILGDSRWVWQERIASSKAIRKVNASALNTTRVVSIRNGTNIEYLCGFQSFATHGVEIDSWGKGALYVGFDYEKSELKGPGFYHPAIKDKALAEKHPDSGVVFDGYKIPFLKEAVDLCLKAHLYLYNHFVIGWDVVITDNGPLILEANEKPGMNAVQAIDGGVRMRIKECYKNTLDQFNIER
jgi:hypothetical protein